MQDEKKIKNFTDLLTWQESHKLALGIYQATETFPLDERFGLISQIRRSAVSISSNIAEGFGRRTMNDKKHFYDMAIGSLFEVQNQLLLSRDLRFVSDIQFQSLWELSISSNRLLNGLIKSLNSL
jgi:four helix bundle protein